MCHTDGKGSPGWKPTWTDGAAHWVLWPRGDAGTVAGGTIQSAGPLDRGPGDHEVTFSVRRSPFLMLK